ncbi:MAG: hypothetical protein H6Q14_598 [Bacteroidetes bacterium]|jgi:hypothetical protein|nr:hypothetical protein [Bacteroidota bacterium]
MDLNLISATLSTEDQEIINQAIKTIREKMPFLSAIQKAEVSGFFKVGTSFQPFLELAKQVRDQYPEILPGVFSKDEFDKDYLLYKSLQPILQQVGQLNEGVGKAVVAVGSDSMDAALEIYAAVKQNKDKVAGLSVTYEAMAAFFKKSKVKNQTSGSVG